MDFSFLFFRMVTSQIKSVMEYQRKKRVKEQVLPDGVKKLGYLYRKDGKEERGCNLYLPEAGDSSSLPLIIDIHGGCWFHGDKDVYDAYNYKLVLKGNVVSTLTYRTADVVTMKEQVQDIFSYLHFLHSNQHRLGISLNEVMLTGDSAGAQLSLLVSAINQSEELQKVFDVHHVDIDFSAMVLSHSVCFVDQATEKAVEKKWLKNIAVPGLLKMLYGEQYQKDPIYLNSVSPARYITEETKLPPIMLVTSRGDNAFMDQTFKLASFFDKHHIPYKLFYEADDNAVHIYNILDPFARLAERCNQAMVDFFHNQISNDHGMRAA